MHSKVVLGVCPLVGSILQVLVSEEQQVNEFPGELIHVIVYIVSIRK